MKPYSFLIFIFFLALLQGTVFPLNLVLLAVLIWTNLRPLKESLLIAFFSGLFLDLAKGTNLGFSSFLLLMISLLFFWCSRKFNFNRPGLLPLFIFLVSFGWGRLIGELCWAESLWLAFFAFVARPLINYYQEGLEFSERLKLKI